MLSSQQKMSDNWSPISSSYLVDFQFGHMAQNFLHLDLQGENSCISAENVPEGYMFDSIDG